MTGRRGNYDPEFASKTGRAFPKGGLWESATQNSAK